MTKKYEKFEEWMVGKTVLWDGNKGVVTREYRGKESCVWVDWESSGMGEAWIEVESLEFLNVSSQQDAVDQPVLSEHTPIPWEVGQEVFCLLRGKGFVVCVGDEDEGIPYTVEVDFGYTFDRYTIDGKIFDDHKGRVLFFSEPTIIADTMPPKKPFVPKLKFDDKLMVINSHGNVEYYGYVEQEFEDSVSMRTGEVYEKVYYNFFKLGEEIKFEEN